jgi:membrane-bound lytic murein transglycosylase D
MKRRYKSMKSGPFSVLPILGFILLFLASCAGPEAMVRTSIEPVPPGNVTLDEEMVQKAAEEKHAPQAVASIEHKRGAIPTLEVEDKLEDMFAAELYRPDTQKDPVTYDIPVTINKEVQRWITHYLGSGRRSYARALARSGIYLPMMKEIFREKGLPEDLVYLSMIESHFVVHAYSKARASGLWQFIPGTARIYGLKINEWVDERRNPEKSTRAAAEYLSHLYEKFGSWYLAAAAYNAGEGKIQKSLKNYNATTFWDLNEKNRLKRETREYVPKFLAALLIAKDPDLYGFNDIAYEPPLAYDEAVVSHPTGLAVIARLSGTDMDTIRGLNPDLKQWCTPMKERDYKICIPKGSGDRFQSAYASLRPDDRITMARHKVAWGETLGSIARLYGTSVRTIKSFNDLKSDRIYKGATIKIPVGATRYYAAQQKVQERLATGKSKPSTDGYRVTYTVKPGDNPWQIARRHNLAWQDIAHWNNMKNVRLIKPGQKLVLYLDEPQGSAASSPKTSVKQQPESVKVAKADLAPETEDSVFYTVRSGDTLWSISRRFKVALTRLRSLNNLSNNLIKPGDVLALGTENL